MTVVFQKNFFLNLKVKHPTHLERDEITPDEWKKWYAVYQARLDEIKEAVFKGCVRRFLAEMQICQAGVLNPECQEFKRNVQKYFHDILNRIVVAVEDELVNILPHKWVEPVTIPLVY